MTPLFTSRRASACVFSGAVFLLLTTLSWSQEMAPSSSGDSPPPAVAAPSAESPASGTAAYTDGSYRLRANDLLRITVFQEDDLTTETRISKSGSINFPLIGSVRVEGRTVNDVTEEIRARLDKDYLVNPHVTLLLVEFSKQMVTVLGEVQKPGQVQIPAEGGLDLLGAIALAGGYTRVANPAHVTVRRMVNGESKIYLVNAKKLARDSTVGQFLVLPGDTINVGQSIF
jgi:polysaccharide export outer membrane protein